MKILVKSYCLVGAMVLGLNTGTLRAQSFVTCGAVSTNLGSKLAFVNSTNYDSSSGFVQPLNYQFVSNHFGLSFGYSATNLLFQSLSQKTNSTAAAFGAYLACQILSVTGPAGATFSFWEQGAGWPTYSFPVGGVYDTNKNWFELGDIENGAGTVGGDPYGSIKARRFSVDKVGTYTVTFQLIDRSKNHPTVMNAPIHVPSDPLTVKFTTGVDLSLTRLALTNSVVTMSFKQSGISNLYVEASTNLPGHWLTVAGPFTNFPPVGSNATTMKFTNDPLLSTIVYRVRAIVPP